MLNENSGLPKNQGDVLRPWLTDISGLNTLHRMAKALALFEKTYAGPTISRHNEMAMAAVMAMRPEPGSPRERELETVILAIVSGRI